MVLRSERCPLAASLAKSLDMSASFRHYIFVPPQGGGMEITMIEKSALKMAAELKEIRHTIHKYPELGTKEYKTSEYIKQKLTEYGVPYKEMALTGVCAYISGKPNGKAVLLRADIDALPITEEADVPFKSERDGLMHACGHDVHTACLLGAAKLLNDIKDKLNGNVVLAFQPDEEGDGGALPMIREGIISDYNVSAAFAMHVEPLCNSGNIQIKDGAIMASPDDFEIIIDGVGGHGAYPEKCVNPIEIGAEILKNYKLQIKNDPQKQIVTICSFNGGHCRNAVPPRAVLTGTARSLDKEIRENLKNCLKNIAEHTAAQMGGKAQFNFNQLFPPVINDTEMNRVVKNAASKLDCIKNVEILENASMAGDDFAYFADTVPGAYFKLGVGTTGENYPIHSPYFMADDNALPIGAALMAQIADEYLNGQSKE